ncbi:MAG: flavodoxin [Clostridia bacterium]|nr:flavodoxin [Clostridia bacterium]
MKKLLGIISVIIVALFGFLACYNNPYDNGNANGNGNSGGGTGNPPTATSKILIAYFSCTTTTEAIANHIEAETKGSVYKIVPEVPYTEEDLKYYTGGRADREQADPSARPAINGSVENIGKYDVIFLGYPIWHGQAPKIIYSFLESYDFSGKKIIPFCTSHSSGIGSSDTDLHSLAPTAEWGTGKRFASGTSQSTISYWIESLNIHFSPDEEEK